MPFVEKPCHVVAILKSICLNRRNSSNNYTYSFSTDDHKLAGLRQRCLHIVVQKIASKCRQGEIAHWSPYVSDGQLHHVDHSGGIQRSLSKFHHGNAKHIVNDILSFLTYHSLMKFVMAGPFTFRSSRTKGIDIGHCGRTVDKNKVNRVPLLSNS